MRFLIRITYDYMILLDISGVIGGLDKLSLLPSGLLSPCTFRVGQNWTG